MLFVKCAKEKFEALFKNYEEFQEGKTEYGNNYGVLVSTGTCVTPTVGSLGSLPRPVSHSHWADLNPSLLVTRDWVVIHPWTNPAGEVMGLSDSFRPTEPVFRAGNGHTPPKPPQMRKRGSHCLAQLISAAL